MSIPSQLSANVARYHFEASQLAPETFQVLRFRGTEGLSELFAFELELIAEDPDIDFSKVINQPAAFTLLRHDESVPVFGIVTDLVQGGRTADHVGYRAMLRPRLWWLSLSFQSRVFQELTVEEILREVLQSSGFTSNDFRFDLQANYGVSEYCIQYQETDLDFVSRLMEHEGIYYFFEHDDGRDVLVITDHRGAHTTVPEPSTLRFHEGAGMVGRDAETVRRLTYREQVVTGAVQLRDYNYETPETVTADSQINSEMPGTRYEYGGGFGDADEGDRLARVRNEEIEAQRCILRGESDSMGLRSGYQFALEAHFRELLNADYLITRVEHEGSQREGLNVDMGDPDDRQDGAPEPDYRNTFTCIPAEVQYRPPRVTPEPDVPGVITARVESAGGDYAYIDDQGRYRARLDFDVRDRSDGTASLPIRMQQAYSGPGYGIHFPNHADTEMILTHVNGDLNRPIALGTVPNPAQSSPATSENKTQNVVRSYAGNQILIDDQEGATKIQLSTTGGHSATLDDGGPKIAISTSGEHSFVMDDDGKRVFLHTADGHGLNMEEGDVHGLLMYTNGQNSVSLDDDNEMIIVQTRGGHTLGMDDANNHLKLYTTDGHGVELNDQDQKAKVATAGERFLECDDAGQKVTLQGNGENNIEIADSDGKVTIKASSEIKLEVGQSSLTLKSDGTIELKGMTVTVDGNQTTVKGKTKTEINGGAKAEYTPASAKITATAILLNS